VSLRSLHVFTATAVRRTRRECPFHRRRCYGEQHEYYDTRRVFFDCGALADYGYGYVQRPTERSSREAQQRLAARAWGVRRAGA